ncbi:hypothetical protein [Rhodoblastus sp.]|uniref:hypothetical protein n=1 Tax=Rhodoblastus sp. TaxID=1962975 RepID=UPI003F9D189B
MPFKRLKSSVENLYNKATNSESFSSIQKLASDAGTAIADKATSISQAVSDRLKNGKVDSDGAAAPEEDASENYETMAALKPIQKLVSEAGTAMNEKARTLLDSDIPELLGAAGGVGVGAAAGAGILTAASASGAAGAAALTSGLATAGSIVGGGMLAGIGVVAAPAVVLGVAGVLAVGRRNRNKLFEAKEALLHEALRKRDALLTELHATNSANHERVAYLTSLVAQLQAAVENLQSDLRAE